jgi:hypothetical protein
MGRSERNRRPTTSGRIVSTGRQLGEGRRKRLLLVVTGLLRRGDPPTPFAREGLLIAAGRSAIVLRGGWTWRDAGRAAREVVHEALRAIGAKRPSWAEASTPHYAQAGSFSLLERIRCRMCGLKIPPENRVFCSPRCYGSYHSALQRAEAAAWAAMLAEGLCSRPVRALRARDASFPERERNLLLEGLPDCRRYRSRLRRASGGPVRPDLSHVRLDLRRREILEPDLLLGTVQGR